MMGAAARMLMIFTGVLIFTMNFFSLAKRKIDPSYSVAWSVFSLLLVVVALVVRLDRLDAFMSWPTFICLALMILVLLKSLYQISLYISKLTAGNQELATQVSLLLEDDRRRRDLLKEENQTAEGGEQGDEGAADHHPGL
jgi:hypothetical protein